MSHVPVVLLCGGSDNSRIVANRLRAEFPDLAILAEGKEDRGRFLKRRLKRLGAVTVAGQLAFTMGVTPILRRRSQARITAILERNGLSRDGAVLEGATHVASVNGPEAAAWLADKAPRVVVVNGTRIIARRVLDSLDATFLNVHCGITPEYRGAHGGYWARASGDAAGVGVTVHLVDPGVDTGEIVAQRQVTPGPEDNFVTYPYLQVAAALPDLIASVHAALAGTLTPHRRDAPSAMWYHPTLWGYCATGLRKGVW